MFTLKIIYESGVISGMECARYTVGQVGGLPNIPDTRFFRVEDSEGDLIVGLTVYCSQTNNPIPLAPESITDIYVMNDAGKTVDHIH